MKSYTVALILAFCVVSNDLPTPTFNPPMVGSAKLSSVELSIPWTHSCKQEESPTIKINVDRKTFYKKACIYAESASGFKVYATKKNKRFEITEKKDINFIQKEHYSGLIYVAEKRIKEGILKFDLLYFSQSAGFNQTENTPFEVELLCNDKQIKLYSVAGNDAPILKVNHAPSSSLAVAITFALLSSPYLTL
ncbi:hypothetical protein DSO57_1011360 [Entomophthora muscae]|uniref:Uncharacterized protein n=1 Tax=Entomophthora muscae TaxID=34485 RepID=A0ACC2SVF5_9FUNG|nr:hypothetical protein DSO57_1011360 [Entomophthora muscae]